MTSDKMTKYDCEAQVSLPSRPSSPSPPPNPSDRYGNPSPLAMGGFATSLLTLSLSMMNLRGVSTQTMNSANLCFVACFGLLISAQWEMARGQTFSYTVLSAYGLFYGGYGAMLLPGFGIEQSFGGTTPEYWNAYGFYVLIWGVFNFFFLIAATRFNLVYVLIFVTLEICLVLDGVSQFMMADGRASLYHGLQTAAGAFAFMAGLLGYYTLCHYLCEDALPFPVPMGSFITRMVKKKQ